ncbi:MAG: biotin/lipoate A/B protein ligase family protein [Halanaeroarchaeum sp.]
MRVVRGRAKTPETDRDASRRLLEWVADHREPAIRAWQPPRQVAFGRRDRNEPGYEEAVERARAHNFPAVERNVGGRAVAYTGTTVAFARYEPVEESRRGIDERYERLTEDVEAALDAVGVEAERGEPPDTFCPGEHSLQRDGKLVGLAQRVTAEAAIASGVLVLDDHEVIAAVTADVYHALGVPFDPTTVDSVARAGGDVDGVLPALEEALVRGEETTELALRHI